jgi:hypothetical protein
LQSGVVGCDELDLSVTILHSRLSFCKVLYIAKHFYIIDRNDDLSSPEKSRQQMLAALRFYACRCEGVFSEAISLF